MKMFSQQARGQHFCGRSQMFLTTLDRTHDGSFRGFSQFLSATLNPCRTGMRAVLVPSAPQLCAHGDDPRMKLPRRGSRPGRWGPVSRRRRGRSDPELSPGPPCAPAACPVEGRVPSFSSCHLQRAQPGVRG